MTDDNLVGQTLAGKYRVEQVLGKGGMGLVLGARHIRLDEPVAIKILRASMMDVDGMVVRFLKEARAASKIKSIHVVRVTDVDTLEDGVPYMVMEHLTGIDFSEMRKREGKLPITDSVGYVLEACEAIGEAHSLGIVHRDLKPSNLFLHQRKDGRPLVKVLDFGISKLDGPGEQDTTKEGQMMGSPKYMSPEQMMSMHHVDGRSDIWSLGAILYEFFTGRPPFLAESTPRICALVLNADPAPPSTLRPELPPELEQIVLRCLEKDADQRFASVAELVDALLPFAPPHLVDSAGSTAMRRASLAGSVTLGGTPRPSVTPGPESASRPVLAASTAGVLPSVTPTPWDAVTRIEGPTPRPHTPGRRRLAALLAGVALLGGLAAVYASQSAEPRGVASGSPQPPVTAEVVTPAAPPAPPVTLAASSSAVVAAVAPAVVVPGALNPGDLPEVGAPAPTKPHPVHEGVAKKPRAPVPAAPPSDPFGGRRN